PASRQKKARALPILSDESYWLRASESGILRALVPVGAKVEAGETVAMISDPFGSTSVEINSPTAGIIIGRTYLPLVHEGEALFHIAKYKANIDRVFSRMEAFNEQHVPDTEKYPPSDIDEPPIY
ncbi:MAG: putative deacylase, partial [Bacteroidia bacterium]